jgi:hypothetical protein
MSLFELLLRIAATYLAVGVVAAAAFSTHGLAAVEAAAKGGPIGFRLMIVPGAAALWPLVLARWARAWRRKDRS